MFWLLSCAGLSCSCSAVLACLMVLLLWPCYTGWWYLSFMSVLFTTLAGKKKLWVGDGTLQRELHGYLSLFYTNMVRLVVSL